MPDVSLKTPGDSMLAAKPSAERPNRPVKYRACAVSRGDDHLQHGNKLMFYGAAVASAIRAQPVKA